MLILDIPGRDDLWNEQKEEFVTLKPCRLKLEHSLISVHKWEQRWHKAFLDKRIEKTQEELFDYILCMSLTGEVDPISVAFMPPDIFQKIIEYIENPMTAATFNDGLLGAAQSQKEIITSETIYYWMIMLGIPVEFEKWHIRSLLALIKFVNIKTGSSNKKMSREESMQWMVQQNAIRKAKLKTKG